MEHDHDSSRGESWRHRLSPDYLRAVERVEALESNRPGANKSWVWEALEEGRLHHERAKRR